MGYINGKKVIAVRTQFIPAVYQEKIITPQNQTHEITPDSDYAGLSKVILNGLLVDPHQSYTSQTDNTIAYQKSVPSGALKYSLLDNLGGMSYKSENLLPNVNQNERTTDDIKWSITNNVATFLKIENNTTQRNYVMDITNFTLQANKTYTLVKLGYSTLGARLYDSNNNTYNGTFTPTENITITKLQWYGTTPYNQEVTVSYMVVEGSTAPTEYQPYFNGIRDSAVTSVVIKGANLWDEQWEVGGIAWSTGQNAVSTTQIRSKNYIPVLPNKTYNIKCDYEKNLFYYDENQNWISSKYLNAITSNFTTPDNCYYMRFNPYASYGATYNNDIIVSYGSTAIPYKPYIAPITKPIPQEIQALTGYGWGVNSSVYNYIDFENKKFIQKVGRIDLGSLDWLLSGAGDNARFITLGIGSLILKGTNNLLCTKYTVISWDNLVNSNNDMVIASRTSDGYLGIRNLSYTDATAFKTAMSGVYLYYELATPIETDISEYIDNNFIEVEGNGTLIFTNQYEQAVPSEITYLVEV